MEGRVVEPVPRVMEKLLRRAVLEHAREVGRGQPPELHVGLPERRQARFAQRAGDDLDATLRVDVVEAMLRPWLASGAVPLVWLTRPVDEDVHDLPWDAAVRSAGEELGLRLGLVVVTRRSWHDPVTGAGRRWQRLRDR